VWKLEESSQSLLRDKQNGKAHHMNYGLKLGEYYLISYIYIITNKPKPTSGADPVPVKKVRVIEKRQEGIEILHKRKDLREMIAVDS